MKGKFWAISMAVLMALFSVATPASASMPTAACDNRNPDHLCQGNITVFAFVDRVERDRAPAFYNSGRDTPLPNARITLVMPDGRRLQQITRGTGYLSFPSIDLLLGDDILVEVEYPARYRGAGLLPCPSSPMRQRLTRESFHSLRSAQVVFCARQN